MLHDYSMQETGQQSCGLCKTFHLCDINKVYVGRLQVLTTYSDVVVSGLCNREKYYMKLSLCRRTLV